eukprot:173653-Chlamydomonas_euryale.AAC.1
MVSAARFPSLPAGRGEVLGSNRSDGSDAGPSLLRRRMPLDAQNENHGQINSLGNLLAGCRMPHAAGCRMEPEPRQGWFSGQPTSRLG